MIAYVVLADNRSAGGGWEEIDLRADSILALRPGRRAEAAPITGARMLAPLARPQPTATPALRCLVFALISTFVVRDSR